MKHIYALFLVLLAARLGATSGTDSLLLHQPALALVALSETPPTNGIDGDDVRHLGQATGVALEAVRKARSWAADLKAAGRFLENLTDADLLNLPVGVQRTIGNVTFTLGIGAMRLGSAQAEVDLFLEIDLPDQEDDPVFGATGVGFSRSGGFGGNIRLELLGDFGFNLREGKSRVVLQAGNAADGSGTYAQVGCEGFQSLTIGGYVVFSRDWLLPVGPDGQPLSDSLWQANNPGTPPDQLLAQAPRVRGDFLLTAQSWDFVVSLGNFAPFVVAGLEDVQWRVGQVSLDFSDFANPPALEFPSDYCSPFVAGGQALPLWRGVYIREVSVQLPEKFSRPDAPPIVLDAERIIIDDQGFTGRVGVYNLLPLQEGNAGGWPFSVDTFVVDIMAMQLREARLAGLINVPLLASRANPAPETSVIPADCLGYTALVAWGNHYSFTARSGSDYTAPLWKAEILIAANSTFNLTYAQGHFTATATLHGGIRIDDDFGGSLGVNVENIYFDNLVLSNQAPYIQTGQWSFPNSVGARMGSFMLNFSDIYLENGESAGEVNLKFMAAIELAGGNSAISASGGFRLEGELEEREGRQRWVYRRLKVESIYLEASTSAWGGVGALHFYERHNTYGNGFRGEVKVWFKGVSPPGAETNPAGSGFGAVAQFGSMPGPDPYRYFFVDVMARWSNGLPLGTLQLMGIGGGVANRMSAGSVTDLSQPPASTASLGASLSGIVYTPDRSRGLRLKATLVVASPGAKNAFSVNGTLEIITNAHGGLDSVRVYGNVTMFGPVNWTNQPVADATGVSIFINMVYDNVGEERGFSAYAAVFINLSAFRGNSPDGPPNYAGSIDLKFSNQTWYVNLGVPSAPLAVAGVFGPLGSLNISAYLDIGNAIPPMPPLPQNVACLTGASANFMRNESLYATGAGFAFGVSVEVPAERKRLVPFYYELGFGLGFDIMLQNYGEAFCANRGERIGINGWYASGQAWAFLQGAFGITVNIFGHRGDFDIIQAAVAAVLQAKGPNPFWGAATVAGQYRILNGLVKGRFNLRVQVGEECLMVGGGENPLASMDLIMSTSPNEGAQDLSLDTRPTAMTTYPLDEPFTFDNESYRLGVVRTTLLHNGQHLPHFAAKEPGDNFLEIRPTELLPGSAEISCILELALLRRVGNTHSDTIRTETRTIVFTTVAGADTIPHSNVAYSYPLNGQYNLYRSESPNGYIKLKQGQAALLRGGPLRARFTRAGGAAQTANASYDSLRQEISFVFPTLSGDHLYKLEIFRPGSGGGPGGSPGTDAPDGESRGPAMPPPPLEAEGLPAAEQVFFTAYFRTSRHARFSDKIAALPSLTTNRGGWATFSLDEPFDQWEIMGDAEVDALLSDLEVQNLGAHPWFQAGGFNALLYQHLPMSGPLAIARTWRGDELGNIPSKGVFLGQSAYPPVIDAAVFTAGSIQMAGQITDTIRCVFPAVIRADYEGYKSQVDSLLTSWVEDPAFLADLNSHASENPGCNFDVNQSGPPIDTDDALAYLLNNCVEGNVGSGACRDCVMIPWLMPVHPLPRIVRDLYQAPSMYSADIRNQTFEIELSYFLPGKTNPQHTAHFQVTFQP